MIKLDDILAICIAALLTLSILFCTKFMAVPEPGGIYYPTEQTIQADS